MWQLSRQETFTSSDLLVENSDLVAPPPPTRAQARLSASSFCFDPSSLFSVQGQIHREQGGPTPP